MLVPKCVSVLAPEPQVHSIVQPAQDSCAAECFRLILSGSGVSINRLLRTMQAPLLLLWGELTCPVCELYSNEADRRSLLLQQRCHFSPFDIQVTWTRGLGRARQTVSWRSACLMLPAHRCSAE
jgi:hypothetical protein